jgi:hypothetical protein
MQLQIIRNKAKEAIEGIVCMAVSSLPEAQSAPAGYSKTGWRRGRGAPSLSEGFGSIATRPQGPLWRRLIAFLGRAISSP